MSCSAPPLVSRSAPRGSAGDRAAGAGWAFPAHRPLPRTLGLAGLLVAAVLISLPCIHGSDTEEPVDLGQGLCYLRVTDLDAALASVHAGLAKTPVVLDLRRAHASPAAVAQLAGWLQAAVTPPGGLVLLLISADTTPALLQGLPAAPRLLTLGVAGAGCTPRLAVDLDPAGDRAASEALATGTSPLQLIEEKIAKRRFDEAQLARNHANGAVDDRAAAAPNPAATPATPTAPLPPPPLRDGVLQRAVFLHRALLALGRLPVGA